MNGAWVITWECQGEHARVEKPFVAVLNYRSSSDSVKKFVEQFYASQYLSPSEKMRVAKNSSWNPYPASFDQIDGIPYEGRITCGHNPFLYARKVDNLRVEIDDKGEKPIWDERPLPHVPG